MSDLQVCPNCNALQNFKCCQKCGALVPYIESLEAAIDAGWALHNTAREQGGSLTVVGTKEYIALLAALDPTPTADED